MTMPAHGGVTPLDVHAIAARLRQHMPLAMRERAQWLLWRAEAVDGRKGLQKVPYYVNGSKRFGDLGSPEDLSRLAHFDAAVDRFVAAERFTGVGFAFLDGDGLIGIDLDHFADEQSGEIRPHHQAIVKLCASYTERSPSGNGLHVIVAGACESFKHDPAGVEVYCGGRYFTCTGDAYEGAPAQVQPLAGYALDYLREVVQRSKDEAKAARAAAAAPPSSSVGSRAAPAPHNGGGGTDDFKRVNAAALMALGAWVPAMFPAARQWRDGYRVRSSDLGRDLEEDLQLTPEGIMDFGEEYGMSPIDAVMKWGPGVSTPKGALDWLAAALRLPLSGAKRRLALVKADDDVLGAGATLSEPPDYLSEAPPPDDVPGDMAPGKPGGRRRSKNLDGSTIDRLIENFALVYGTDTVWDGERRGVMAVKNLRLLFGAPYVNAWLGRPERRLLLPEQIKFEPGKTLSDECVNLFDGLPTEPVPCDEAAVKPMLDLLRHLTSLSGPTPERVQAVFDQVLRWCALIVQQPGAKIRFALVFHGPQGTGKNLFCDGLRKILGKYGKMVGQTELEDRFNGYMSGKLLLIGNEVVTRQELFHNKNKLKWVITEDEIPIRGMHQEVRWESNHANVIFLSNELMPVALEWDDRRHLVVYTPAADDHDLYLRVIDFLEDDGLGKWMHYLQHVDLDDFHEHSRPLMTEAKAALIDLGLKPGERFVGEWLSGMLDLPVRVCSAEQLFRVYAKWCTLNGERDFKGQAMFTRTVERYVRERHGKGEDGKRLEPALTYKPIALKDPKEGGRKTVRCWLPRGTAAPNGVTEGEWAWSAVAAFESAVSDFTRGRGEGDE